MDTDWTGLLGTLGDQEGDYPYYPDILNQQYQDEIGKWLNDTTYGSLNEAVDRSKTVVNPDGTVYFYDKNNGFLGGVGSGGQVITGTGGNEFVSVLKNLFSGTGDLGKLGQLGAFAGLAGLANQSNFFNPPAQKVGFQGVIPKYEYERQQTPLSVQRPEGYRPGQGGVTYFTPGQYYDVGYDPATAGEFLNTDTTLPSAPETTESQLARGGLAYADGGFTNEQIYNTYQGLLGQGMSHEQILAAAARNPNLNLNAGQINAALAQFQAPKFTDQQFLEAGRTALQQGLDPQTALQKAAEFGASQDQLNRLTGALGSSGIAGLVTPTTTLAYNPPANIPAPPSDYSVDYTQYENQQNANRAREIIDSGMSTFANKANITTQDILETGRSLLQQGANPQDVLNQLAKNPSVTQATLNSAAAALGASGYKGVTTPMTKFTSQTSGALTGDISGAVTGGSATNTGGISTLSTVTDQQIFDLGKSLLQQGLDPQTLLNKIASQTGATQEQLNKAAGWLGVSGYKGLTTPTSAVKTTTTTETTTPQPGYASYAKVDTSIPGGRIVAYDKYGVQLSSIPLGESGYKDLNRLLVDPESYKKAVQDLINFQKSSGRYSAVPESTWQSFQSMANAYKPLARESGGKDYLIQGIDPIKDASRFFGGERNPMPNIKEFMDKSGVDFNTATNLLYANPFGSKGAMAMVDWSKIMAAKNPAQALMAAYGAIASDPKYSKYGSQAVAGDYEGWQTSEGPVVDPSKGVYQSGVLVPPKGTAVTTTPAPRSTIPTAPTVRPTSVTPTTTTAAIGRVPTTPAPTGGISTIPTQYTQALMAALARAAAARRATPTTASRTTAKQAGIGSLTPTTVLRRKPVGGAAGGDVTMLAKGRYLKGNGDGVSDSIDAKFVGSGQPAALADGEFVVPARVVSELGNGSSDAGARKLYAMLDRVEQRARKAKRGKPSGADRELKKLA